MILLWYDEARCRREVIKMSLKIKFISQGRRRRVAVTKKVPLFHAKVLKLYLISCQKCKLSI